MPRFSEKSLSKLSTCHIDIQRIFFEVIKYFDCTILEGYRNEKDQNNAYLDGKSKLKWPNGNHNKIPSLAIDVAPYPIPNWNKGHADFYYFGGWVMMCARMLKEQGKISHSIRYGADWNKNHRITDEKFIDAVHFEIVE